MRRQLTTRRLAAAASLPLLLAGLVACGGDTETASDQTSESSSETTSESPSEDTTEEAAAEGEEIDPAAFAEDMTAGLEAMTTARMSMEMTGQATMTMEGVVDYTRDSPAMQATMSGAGMPGEMEMIMLDGIMYMTAPGQNGKYMKIDLTDPNGPMASMGLDELSGQMDMRELMNSFTPALTGVTLVGEEEVDGEDLTHYEITMDPSKIESMKGLAGNGIKEMTYDAWFDADNVMRQMVMEMPEGLGTMTMKLFDLGTDATIEAPPAGRVVKMPGS